MNQLSRRNFLLASSGAAVGSLLVPGLAESNNDDALAPKSGLVTGQLKPLRYTSIPGFLSIEQLTPHYAGHYSGALGGYVAADEKLRVSSLTGNPLDTNAYATIQQARTSKGNSVLLHELYFDAIALKTNEAKADVQAAIKKRFGSMSQWATDFKTSAKTAKGWAILAVHPLNGKLYNLVSDEHAVGLLWMATPLLVIDVYEHAYYVDYKNNKADYIEKYMSHIDWEIVNRRYQAAARQISAS